MCGGDGGVSGWGRGQGGGKESGKPRSFCCAMRGQPRQMGGCRGTHGKKKKGEKEAGREKGGWRFCTTTTMTAAANSALPSDFESAFALPPSHTVTQNPLLRPPPLPSHSLPGDRANSLMGRHRTHAFVRSNPREEAPASSWKSPRKPGEHPRAPSCFRPAHIDGGVLVCAGHKTPLRHKPIAQTPSTSRRGGVVESLRSDPRQHPRTALRSARRKDLDLQDSRDDPFSVFDSLAENLLSDNDDEQDEDSGTISDDDDDWDEETTLVAFLHDRSVVSPWRLSLGLITVLARDTEDSEPPAPSALVDKLGPAFARSSKRVKQDVLDSLLPAMRRIRVVDTKLSEDTDRNIAAGVLEVDNACKHFEEVQLQGEEELSRALSETQVIFLATRPRSNLLCIPEHAYIDYRSCRQGSRSSSTSFRRGTSSASGYGSTSMPG